MMSHDELGMFSFHLRSLLVPGHLQLGPQGCRHIIPVSSTHQSAHYGAFWNRLECVWKLLADLSTSEATDNCRDLGVGYICCAAKVC